MKKQNIEYPENYMKKMEIRFSEYDPWRRNE